MWPILILDDITAELDATRQKAFMGAIPETVQIMLSMTDRDYTTTRTEMKMFRVDNGDVIPIKLDSGNNNESISGYSV